MTAAAATEPASPRVLIIDDNPDDRFLVEREIKGTLPHLALIDVRTAGELEAAIAEGFDAAVTDYELRWATGLDVFRRLRAACPDCPVIMFTASGSEEVAVEGLKEGLDDYITKTPKHYPRIPHALKAALTRARDQRMLLLTQEALAARAGELAAILDATPAAIWVAHDDSGQRITGNAYAATLLGLPDGRNHSVSAPEGERPRHFKLLQNGAELPSDRLPLQRAARGEPISDTEFTLAFDDGRYVTLFGRSQTLHDERGRPRGAVFAAVDVTARKRAEDALRQADRRKDEFLATLAHELRNPMAPIRYATAMLRRDAPQGVLEQARATIERQSAHMARLLDDLLDMSRITRNVIELQREALDLCALVQEAAETARPAILALDHHFEVSVPPAPVWIHGDMTRLLQVLGNLLNNAAKYTPPGGRIEISAGHDGSSATISVRDSGIGLAPEMQPKVFELFSQVHHGLSVTKGGLGIGLAVAKRLVELHGGTLAVRSDGLGHGSTFTVRLPRLESAPVTATSRDDEAVKLFRGEPSVLVVDDNQDAAESLALILRTHGVQVHTAYDGTSALRIADETRPMVVVLDIGLPDVSGIEVARRLRERHGAAGPTVIAVSGWGQAEDRRLTQEVGIALHLVKPVEPDQLMRHIGAAAMRHPEQRN